MTNPVLARNTTALRGTGATVQGIALITLLYLGFVVSAAMMAWQHPELFVPRIIVLTFAGLGVGLFACYAMCFSQTKNEIHLVLFIAFTMMLVGMIIVEAITEHYCNHKVD